MIKAVRSYVASEVGPRLRRIVVSPETLLAFAVGTAIALRIQRWSLAHVQVVDVVTVLLAYSSIALGFCVAGLTIALTLPDRQFASKLANTRLNGRRQDAYSDLLFVFSWTAVAHWVCILLFLMTLLFGGHESEVFPIHSGGERRIVIGGLGGVVIYSLVQFLVVLITLSQVGNVYIRSLEDRQNDGEKRG